MSEQPFPFPKTFPCPYCGEAARTGNYTDPSSQLHCSHAIIEKKRISQHIVVELETRHQFVVKWSGESWQAVDEPFGSSKVCERAEFGNGENTGWRGHNDIQFRPSTKQATETCHDT